MFEGRPPDTHKLCDYLLEIITASKAAPGQLRQKDDFLFVGVAILINFFNLNKLWNQRGF